MRYAEDKVESFAVLKPSGRSPKMKHRSKGLYPTGKQMSLFGGVSWILVVQHFIMQSW